MLSITFVIPVSPGLFPADAIEHIRQLEYPPEKIEILVVSGNRPSVQRNRAVQEAMGDLIYFLDDDSFIDRHSLVNSLRYFEDKRVASVGGPAITYNDASEIEECFGAAMASGFAMGPVKVRSRIVGEAREVRGEELILCNLLVRKDVYESSGGLNPSLYPNEENEFLKRLRGKGYKFFYVPCMLVRRTRRKALPAFILQMHSYGAGRARHIFKNFELRDLIFFLPSALTVYLLLLPFVLYLTPALLSRAILLIPMTAYLLGGLFAASRSALRERNGRIFLTLPILFPVIHVSYGLGVMGGVLRFWRGAEVARAAPVPILVSRIGPPIAVLRKDEVFQMAAEG